MRNDHLSWVGGNNDLYYVFLALCFWQWKIENTPQSAVSRKAARVSW